MPAASVALYAYIVIRSIALPCFVQALVGADSPSKRTRLTGKGSPGNQAAAVEAKRAVQADDLDRDVKQVMDYADEKVLLLCRHAFAIANWALCLGTQ